MMYVVRQRGNILECQLLHKLRGSTERILTPAAEGLSMWFINLPLCRMEQRGSQYLLHIKPVPAHAVVKAVDESQIERNMYFVSQINTAVEKYICLR